MLTHSASSTFIRNNRIHSFFQYDCRAFKGTSLKTTSTYNHTLPCITELSIKLCKSHSYIFNGNIMEGIRWTDSAASHTKMASSIHGIDYGSSCNKRIKSSMHGYAIIYTYLGTLPALQAACQKFLFTSCSGWS